MQSVLNAVRRAATGQFELGVGSKTGASEMTSAVGRRSGLERITLAPNCIGRSNKHILPALETIIILLVPDELYMASEDRIQEEDLS